MSAKSKSITYLVYHKVYKVIAIRVNYFLAYATSAAAATAAAMRAAAGRPSALGRRSRPRALTSLYNILKIALMRIEKNQIIRLENRYLYSQDRPTRNETTANNL